jgi:hypothetical protein
MYHFVPAGVDDADRKSKFGSRLLALDRFSGGTRSQHVSHSCRQLCSHSVVKTTNLCVTQKGKKTE